MSAPRRRVVVMLLALQCAACWTWRPVAMAPGRVIAEGTASNVRVTRRDGRRIVLDLLEVRGDSVAARRNGRGLTLAVDDIQAIEVPDFSPVRSILLIPIGYAVLYGLVVLLVVSDPSY